MKEIKGGVTSAKGFQAAGVEAAIKYKNRKDMAMVYSEVPCQRNRDTFRFWSGSCSKFRYC